MHYRNGREAKNGDRVVQLSYEGGKLETVGILHNAVAGNDYCNGALAPCLPVGVASACLIDCIHVDDLAEILKAAGIDKRPDGK
jgi:hypothetical protein